ncbi:MAG: 30S ribosomal protein S17 [Patescibacteria group bacterium]
MSKKFVGTVVSDKMIKTVVVSIATRSAHPIYQKVLLRRKRFQADNQIGAKLGDRVEIIETRPLSRLKRFSVKRVIKQDQKK